jgi:hypothetical protein
MTVRFDPEHVQRQVNIRKAPKASLKTRVALVVHQRGITEKQLEKFYVGCRGGKRFDYIAPKNRRSASIGLLMER